MIEKIREVFNNEHGELIAQREAEQLEYDAVDRGFALRIEELLAKPLTCIADLDRTREAIKKATDDRARLRTSHGIRAERLLNRIIETAPQAISEKIYQLRGEIELSQSQISIKGHVQTRGMFRKPRSALARDMWTQMRQRSERGLRRFARQFKNWKP